MMVFVQCKGMMVFLQYDDVIRAMMVFVQFKGIMVFLQCARMLL